MNKTKVFAFRLPNDVAEEFQALCNTRGITPTEALVKAVEHYILDARVVMKSPEVTLHGQYTANSLLAMAAALQNLE